MEIEASSLIEGDEDAAAGGVEGGAQGGAEGGAEGGDEDGDEGDPESGSESDSNDDSSDSSSSHGGMPGPSGYANVGSDVGSDVDRHVLATLITTTYIPPLLSFSLPLAPLSSVYFLSTIDNKILFSGDLDDMEDDHHAWIPHYTLADIGLTDAAGEVGMDVGEEGQGCRR